MKRNYYAMIVDSHSINQSRECRKYWNTASVRAYDSKAARDAFCCGSPYRIPISAKEARYYGVDSFHRGSNAE